jgi:hypothetical protein
LKRFWGIRKLKITNQVNLVCNLLLWRREVSTWPETIKSGISFTGKMHICYSQSPQIKKSATDRRHYSKDLKSIFQNLPQRKKLHSLDQSDQLNWVQLKRNKSFFWKKGKLNRCKSFMEIVWWSWTKADFWMKLVVTYHATNFGRLVMMELNV